MQILRDPNPVLLCCSEDDLQSDERPEYAVPVFHEAGGPEDADKEVLDQLAADLGEDHPVIAHARAHSGTRFFVPKKAEGQDAMGALLLFPAVHWPDLKKEWGDWLHDRIEDEFEGLDFGFDDVMPFMKRNYSPDLWFVVLRGPKQGHIGYWSHDGDSEEDLLYADSLDAALDRASTELDEFDPDAGLRAFGGVNVYPGTYSPEAQAASVEYLHPIRYEPNQEG